MSAVFIGMKEIARTDDAVKVEFSYKWNGEIRHVEKCYNGRPDDRELRFAIVMNGLKLEREATA